MRSQEFIVEYKKYPTAEYEGVTFTMAERDGQLVVKALNDFGIPMGHVVFNMDGKLLDPQDLSVSEKYQGQGIARVMYDYIKSRGFTIERSWDQTPAGRGFWNKHRGEDVRVWEDEQPTIDIDALAELNESLSRIAYHYTNTASALKILKSGYFELSSTLGSTEQQYSPPGQHYFMSTTRTKTGGYHSKVMSSGVLFVLDGNWFNNHYKSGAMDYWSDRAPTSYGSASEAEDRVYSRKPTIPIDGVSAVHVLLEISPTDPEAEGHNRAMVRELLITAKTRGIPAYFYTNKKAWFNLDTRHLGDVKLLTGAKEPEWYRLKRQRSHLENWIELMMAKSQKQLTKEADKLRHNLNHNKNLQYVTDILANDMSNARKPDAGQDRDATVKIIAYMRQHRLTTISQFVDHIADKWKDITSAEKNKHRNKDVRIKEDKQPTIGINVRSDNDLDYADLIVNGIKKYESRRTDSLRPYVGKTVAIVRTGNGPATAIGQVTIGEPIIVDAIKFDQMRKQHLVPAGSKFDVDAGGEKYLYPMINPLKWDQPKMIKHKGIVARKVDENFADGKKPGRKGLAKRTGVNCKQSVSKLRSIAAHSSGERQRMAHWCANMKSGKKK